MPIEVEKRGRVTEIVFNHPPVNAFGTDIWRVLPGMITDAGKDTDTHCILIRAEGRGFQGGVDIKEMQAHPERIVDLNKGNYLTFKAIRDCPVPVVCALSGFVIGGGVNISGAADVLIASDDAYFSLPEIDRGAMGGASAMMRILPLLKVRAAFFTGGKVSAQEAYRLGGVEKVVPKDQLLEEARAFCDIIASKSRAALVIAKEALTGLEERDMLKGYRWEQGFTLEMYMHEDSQTARDAFVENKGAAKF